MASKLELAALSSALRGTAEGERGWPKQVSI